MSVVFFTGVRYMRQGQDAPAERRENVVLFPGVRRHPLPPLVDRMLDVARGISCAHEAAILAAPEPARP